MRTVWTRKGLRWQQPNIHEILGIGLRAWTEPTSGKEDIGVTRLWRILGSESAYMVWKLRCERTIGHSDQDGWEHSARTVRNKWVHSINARLILDRAMTHKRFGRSALSQDVALKTWRGTLENEEDLTDDWIKTRVLVGIAPGIPQWDPG
ncbi:uncharacterized protein B0H18DRAFT_888860 [Fomitopsis serialis]|uniref:uncharacterized protein n=1 Tax=Fomitopsis serialis TaxID=139415 RepID=UPI002007E437|nr:uncharacterized protein B0H18DRAFT_888860 [Neoantrodia serialis]KAH9913114.1 hypothetical protein B0H18DRAFT_888860 [Neoantrodia serialis]